MIKEAIAGLAQNKDLTQDTMQQAVEEIMTGKAAPDEIEAFLRGLSTKGESIDEITAAAFVMRRHATKITSPDGLTLDTCGTGGDGAHTFNISTLSALVACGAGVTVAKHGNKSVSSECGSADLLLELGVKIDLLPSKVETCLAKVGIGFLYAPLLHQAMKYAMPVRKKMAVRTIFNILGPLTNPAGAQYQLLGVFDAKLTESLANVLKNLGSKHVLVVHGDDGLDEVTITTTTQVSELKNDEVKTYKISPDDFGIKKAMSEDLKGADAVLNAKLTQEILQGKQGSQRDIVLLNAGCAIYAADKVASIKEGIAKAAESIDSGNALKKLELLRKFTNR